MVNWKKDFDYYVFIDFSEKLIGYNIIEKNRAKELLPKIIRFRHYKGSRDRKIYLNHIKETIKREKIRKYFEKIKIMNVRDNVEVFAEVLDFVKKNESKIIFVSVDDFQFRAFKKLAMVLDGKRTEVVKESQLKKGTLEYQISLIIDNLLNIERRKNEKS